MILNEGISAAADTGIVISSSDPDAGDSVTYSVDDDRFEVKDGRLHVKAGQSFDFETEPSVELTITSTDTGGLASSRIVTLNVSNVNEAPSVPISGAQTVTLNEGTSIASDIGITIIATDPDEGDEVTLKVSDDRFEVIDGKLRVKAGQKFDFETEPTVDLTITGTDKGALTEQRVSSLTDQIRGLQAQRASNARQLDIVRQELSNLETLLDKGLIAVARVNARRVEAERLTGVDAVLHAQEAQSRNEISALRLSTVATQTLRDEAASTELAQIEASLATLEPQYTGAVERLKRVAIVAPVSGRVVEMTVFTAGGVIRPGAPILDIVPLDEPLVVEARVNTADIEKLYVGQSSRVRLSAFDQGDVPEAQGTIVGISADSLEDERTGQFYYVARVKLDDEQTSDVAALDLVPGMPADLFVNTGERTALSYLTQPLSDRLARTFIE